jgi:hypothetical protein
MPGIYVIPLSVSVTDIQCRQDERYFIGYVPPFCIASSPYIYLIIHGNNDAIRKRRLIYRSSVVRIAGWTVHFRYPE